MTLDPSDELFQKYERHYLDSGAARWQVPIQEVKELHLDRLPRWLGRVDRHATILDAGCATGYLLSLLWDAGYQNLVGVDLSEELAARARQNLAESVAIEVSDIRDFLAQTADGSYDVILFHHVLEHISREYTIPLLREFYRCLRPGGYLNIKVPNASFLLAGNHCFGDFTHVVHFNERSLPQVLEAARFDTRKLEFILHPPRLYWSWRRPSRAFLRLLNRLRWHLHRASHKALCALIDQHPVPKVFEAELEALAQR
jgi:SAM-dependent methyltransferase